MIVGRPARDLHQPGGADANARRHVAVHSRGAGGGHGDVEDGQATDRPGRGYRQIGHVPAAVGAPSGRRPRVQPDPPQILSRPRPQIDHVQPGGESARLDLRAVPADHRQRAAVRPLHHLDDMPVTKPAHHPRSRLPRSSSHSRLPGRCSPHTIASPRPAVPHSSSSLDSPVATTAASRPPASGRWPQIPPRQLAGASASPPCTPIQYNCPPDPNNSESESGAHRGTPAHAVPEVSLLGGELALAGTTHSALTCRSFTPVVVTTYATQRPSGEITGSSGTAPSATSSAITPARLHPRRPTVPRTARRLLLLS